MQISHKKTEFRDNLGCHGHRPQCSLERIRSALARSPVTMLTGPRQGGKTTLARELLTDALVLRQFHPWHANLGKRQVRSPEIHVRDRGLLHHLPGLERVAVIYPGAKRYPLGDALEAVPLTALTTPGTLFDGESPAA
jgi:predicted AAA+ superfamily ATPase